MSEGMWCFQAGISAGACSFFPAAVISTCAGRCAQGPRWRRGRRSPPQAALGAGAKGKPLVDAQGNARLHVVFVQPKIPWNTGNMARTCLGLGATLHLIQPLGFSLEQKQVRRAGLDYWEFAKVEVHGSWDEFVKGRMKELGGLRLFFTKFGEEGLLAVEWPKKGNVVLVFGNEVEGLQGVEEWMKGEGKEERKVAVGMVDDRIRCFNLSTTASMVC